MYQNKNKTVKIPHQTEITWNHWFNVKGGMKFRYELPKIQRMYGPKSIFPWNWEKCRKIIQETAPNWAFSVELWKNSSPSTFSSLKLKEEHKSIAQQRQLCENAENWKNRSCEISMRTLTCFCRSEDYRFYVKLQQKREFVEEIFCVKLNLTERPKLQFFVLKFQKIADWQGFSVKITTTNILEPWRAWFWLEIPWNRRKKLWILWN